MSRSDPEDRPLDHLYVEARDTARAQRDAADRVDTKASEILRFDALVLGVLATGASLSLRGGGVSELPAWTTGALVVGFGSLVGSMLFAIRSYRFTEAEIGPRAEDLLDAYEQDAEAREVLAASFRMYAEGVKENRRALDRASRWLRASLRSLGWGLAVIAGVTAILMVLEAALWV